MNNTKKPSEAYIAKAAKIVEDVFISGRGHYSENNIARWAKTAASEAMKNKKVSAKIVKLFDEHNALRAQIAALNKKRDQLRGEIHAAGAEIDYDGNLVISRESEERNKCYEQAYKEFEQMRRDLLVKVYAADTVAEVAQVVAEAEGLKFKYSQK